MARFLKRQPHHQTPPPRTRQSAVTPSGHSNGYLVTHSSKRQTLPEPQKPGQFFNHTLGITGLTDTHPLNAPIVGETHFPGSQGGYYLFGADGGVFNFGTAPFEGSNANTHLGTPVIGEITL
ncbi:hypothetical protein [Ferrimicrobium sp.]|uniref:hypothetical protein n=1 Tax=Ferrimicrobium sp. TaxID=2926050 RepID=UPI00261B83B9|nr:hypothetical protein [Ferrimicrobium sp.]